MSAAAFAAGITTLLGSDPILVPAIEALLGQPLRDVIVSNVPVSQIPTDQQPCWILEQGDGNAESLSNDTRDDGLVIGLSESQFGSDLHLSLMWQEHDRGAAANQRAQLPMLLAQLMLRNPQPGGIDFARLTDWEPDRGIHHPQHIWRATLRGQYAIPRA